MDERICVVDGCGKLVKHLDYCGGHYMKNWRHGTPTPEHAPYRVDLRGKRFGTLTVVEFIGPTWRCVCDCGRERLVKAGNLNQSGDANRCGDKTAHRAGDSGYGAAHWRCRNDRGPAKYHQCVDCGDPACHWSYNYTDPDELMDTPGTQTPIPYSLSPAHYSPRCAPCHKRFDLDRAP